MRQDTFPITYRMTPAVASCGFTWEIAPELATGADTRFAASAALPVLVTFADARHDTRGRRPCDTTERDKRQSTGEGAPAEREGAGTFRIVNLFGHPNQAAIQTRKHRGLLLIFEDSTYDNCATSFERCEIPVLNHDAHQERRDEPTE